LFYLPIQYTDFISVKSLALLGSLLPLLLLLIYATFGVNSGNQGSQMLFTGLWRADVSQRF